MKTRTKLAVVVAVLGFAAVGCATPYHHRQYPQERVVLVPAPQPPQQVVVVVVQPQGTPTAAGGIIIPNAHDFGPGCRYAQDQFGRQIIICPQPTMVYDGRAYRGTPYPYGHVGGGYAFDPGAVLGHLAVGAAGTAVNTKIYCAVSGNCRHR